MKHLPVMLPVSSYTGHEPKFDVFFNFLRFLKMWAWLTSIHFLFLDTCINVTHVSNSLKFDTFLLSYFLLKTVSVMTEPHCHKKLVTCLTKSLKWLWYDISTKSTIYKYHFTRAAVRTCSTKLLVFSEVFLKISQISLDNTCTVYDANVWCILSTVLLFKRLRHTFVFQWVSQNF